MCWEKKKGNFDMKPIVNEKCIENNLDSKTPCLLEILCSFSDQHTCKI